MAAQLPAQRWHTMSDTPSGTPPRAASPEPHGVDQARSALDRAHRAAIAMDGGELRRALEEAREILDGSDAPGASAASAKVARALADLDEGPLDEMERLLEQARADLGPAT